MSKVFQNEQRAAKQQAENGTNENKARKEVLVGLQVQKLKEYKESITKNGGIQCKFVFETGDYTFWPDSKLQVYTKTNEDGTNVTTSRFRDRKGNVPLKAVASVSDIIDNKFDATSARVIFRDEDKLISITRQLAGIQKDEDVPDFYFADNTLRVKYSVQVGEEKKGDTVTPIMEAKDESLMDYMARVVKFGDSAITLLGVTAPNAQGRVYQTVFTTYDNYKLPALRYSTVTNVLAEIKRMKDTEKAAVFTKGLENIFSFCETSEYQELVKIMETARDNANDKNKPYLEKAILDLNSFVSTEEAVSPNKSKLNNLIASVEKAIIYNLNPTNKYGWKGYTEACLAKPYDESAKIDYTATVASSKPSEVSSDSPVSAPVINDELPF